MRGTFKAVAAAGLTVAVAGLGVAVSQRTAPVVEAGHVGAETAAAKAAITQLEQMAAAGDIHAGHALEVMAQQPFYQAAPAMANMPPDAEGATARLASSPRKGEFVEIDVNGTKMRTWVVRPARSGPAPVVVVIQEVFGLSDWIRGVADQLAAEGFIAVAPDVLAGRGPNGGDSRAFADQPTMVQNTMQMPAAEVIAKLKAAREWGLKQPGANGKSATVGYCYGGSQSFAMAVAEPGLNAAVVYYGAAPTDVPPAPQGSAPAAFVPSPSLANIKAPILGLYGGLKEDARIGATIAPTQAKMKELGKTYEVHIFDGAAHGFLRAQSGNNGANMKATHEAWPLTVNWIKKYAS
jgi:carboxymethylenebutenolidase